MLYQTIEEAEKQKEESNENNKQKKNKLNIFAGLKKKEAVEEKPDNDKLEENSHPIENVIFSSPL